MKNVMKRVLLLVALVMAAFVSGYAQEPSQVEKAVKNVDESYNEYQFLIKTDIQPSSVRLEKQAAKQAKRDAKGKKKRSVEDLM